MGIQREYSLDTTMFKNRISLEKINPEWAIPKTIVLWTNPV